MKQKTKFSIFALVLSLLISGCSAAGGVKPSQATADQFLTNMTSGQSGAAYQMLSSNCKAATTQQQMQSYWDLGQKKRGRVQSWDQQSFYVSNSTSGSSVQLVYQLQCANGPAAIRFTLVPENDKWLIQAFAFSK